jgi:phosphohistidine phosphatase
VMVRARQNRLASRMPMAQQLWFLRHGDAEAHGLRHDAERQLTGKGEHQAKAAGAALKALGLDFSEVLTSPRVRARDTARLAAKPLGADPHVHQPLSAGFDAEQARALLAGQEDDARVLVVGHEPDFSQTVHDLTGATIDLKKGGLAGVRMDGTRGELIVLMRPKDLDRLAGA